jgi:hypothetical protein
MAVPWKEESPDATSLSFDVSTDRHLRASATLTWVAKSKHTVRGQAVGCRCCTGGNQLLDGGFRARMSDDWVVVVPASRLRRLEGQCCVPGRWDYCYYCGGHYGRMRDPTSSWRRSGVETHLVSRYSSSVRSERWALWVEASYGPCRVTPSCQRGPQRQWRPDVACCLAASWGCCVSSSDG